MHFKEFCRVLRLEAQAIESALSRFETNPAYAAILESVVELILNQTNQGGKVVLLGVGKSGKIAAKIAATFSSTGTEAHFIHPTEALHGDLGVVGKNDVILALSYTGNTEELLTLLPYFERRGTPVIALTGNLQSKLAQKSKFSLDCSVNEEACAHNLAPTSSTTLTLALGDALAVTLMQARKFNAEDFALNHPGGSLGRRLQLLVKDLMHPLEKTPLVSKTASMDEVLNQSTQYKLGAVLVCEGAKLLGIITDGDIRRALSQKEKFFSLQAEAIMTRSPTTISADRLAYDALRMMEDRESQISVLPVMNASGDALGLLRIHDLVQSF